MKYFRNTSWLFAEQVLRMIVALLVGIWVARYLGPEQFGVFSYVVAFTSLFAGIAKLGLDGILVRELVNRPELTEQYIATAFWLKVIGALVVIGLIALVLPWTSNTAANSTYIFIIAAGLVFQATEVVDFYFQAHVLARLVSICKITQLIVSSVAKIYLMLTGANLLWFVWVSLLDQFTVALSLCLAYRYRTAKYLPLRHFDFKVAGNLLKDSWPLIISSIMIMVYTRIDQVMIKEMLGEHEVGIFSAAVRLSEVWYFIPTMITASLFPAILNAKKIGEPIYLQRLQRLYNFMVWLAISIAIPMTFLSDWLVVQLYGEDFRMAGTILKIHIWTSVFVCLGVSSGKWLLSENLQSLLFWRTLYGAVINVVLNVIFITKYGISGAAVATLISQIFAAYLFDVFNKKTRSLFVMKSKSFFMLS